MRNSSVDIFMSRRDCFEQCQWWERNEDNQYMDDELIMKNPSSGYFWAKEVTPENVRTNIIGGNFMFDQNTVAIRSPDNLGALKNNDIVLYQGEKWIVIDVQKKHFRERNLEFSTDGNSSHFWYVNLRR